VGAGAGWGVDGLGSLPGKILVMARMRKWLKVGQEVGYDRPEERSGWARKRK
jgi:hypothetical protein